MTLALRWKFGLKLPLCLAGATVAVMAHAATKSTLDLTAGAGASSNPTFRVGGGGSAFGRISALGTHQWLSERTTTTFSVFGEQTAYLNNYGSKQVFDLRARSRHAVNSKLDIFGSAGFQGDFAGQLSNRFSSVFPDVPAAEPSQPTPALLDQSNLIGFGGRQFRLSGEAGASLRSSARSTMSLSGGAQRVFSSQTQEFPSFNTYFGSAAGAYSLSEKTSVGARLNVQVQDYDSSGSSRVLNPALTIQHQFSERLQGSASVGLLLVKQHPVSGASTSLVDPSFAFGLCRVGERDRFCGRASRDARSTVGVGVGAGAGALTVNTSGGIDYSRRIDANQTFQLSITADRYINKFAVVDDVQTTYLTFLTGYDRKIRRRVAVGATVGARRLFQTGTDPSPDFTATGYLRYRFGDTK
jgi:hypothetical protein